MNESDQNMYKTIQSRLLKIKTDPLHQKTLIKVLKVAEASLVIKKVTEIQNQVYRH